MDNKPKILVVGSFMLNPAHAAAITVCGYGAIPSLPNAGQVQKLMNERRTE